MELLGVLAGALTAREGWASAEAERAYRRALELARELGDERSRAALLYGLAGLHEYRGQYRASETLLDEALRLDETEPARLVEAHELMACSLFHQGSFETAVEQADRGLALHEPAQRHPIPATAGEDPAVSCNDWAGLSLWCLGHTEQALERIKAALEMAALPGRSFSKAAAHMHAARLHQLRRVPGEVRAQSEAALALAQEHGFGYPAAVARMLLGWALGQNGAVEDGIEMLTAGLDAHRATGAEMDRPYFLALMAETLLAARRPAEALTHVIEALETGAEERSFFYEAELHRLHAAALLDMSGSEAAQEGKSSAQNGPRARTKAGSPLTRAAPRSLAGAGARRTRRVPRCARPPERDPRMVPTRRGQRGPARGKIARGTPRQTLGLTTIRKTTIGLSTPVRAAPCERLGPEHRSPSTRRSRERRTRPAPCLMREQLRTEDRTTRWREDAALVGPSLLGVMSPS